MPDLCRFTPELCFIPNRDKSRGRACLISGHGQNAYLHGSQPVPICNCSSVSCVGIKTSTIDTKEWEMEVFSLLLRLKYGGLEKVETCA
jgi:hypothetical protein